MKKQKEERQVRPGGAMPPGPAPPMQQGVAEAQPQLPVGHPQSQQMPPQQPQQIAPPSPQKIPQKIPQQVPQQPAQPAGTPVPPAGGPTQPTGDEPSGRKIRVKCPYCDKEFEITA